MFLHRVLRRHTCLGFGFLVACCCNGGGRAVLTFLLRAFLEPLGMLKMPLLPRATGNQNRAVASVARICDFLHWNFVGFSRTGAVVPLFFLCCSRSAAESLPRHAVSLCRSRPAKGVRHAWQ